MNAANLKTSDRLKRVDAFLSDCMPHSTMEIIQGTQTCAISAIVSELRQSGRKINCSRKGRIWLYRRVK